MRDPVELIRSFCRDGDTAAFREFYRTQSPRLWKFLVARGCLPEDAYDLVSEAFLRFVQTVCRDPRAPRAYLYRIAVNLRIDALRRARARPTEPLLEETAESTGGSAREEAAYLRELVSRLPEREQNLLLLRYWIGLSHREVAQALGLPEGTARRQCAEVIARLREHWSKDETRSTD
ncbi:MAG: sigma-70 family RNA polymerase sigma factor [Gammaproteobacteria bacterium]|nr:sigma-70 family RNA polymerase sigma factor [Gammaproteobacteria bacterium]